MDREEIDELEDKMKDDVDALRLIDHIKNLHGQIDRMYEVIGFLEEDVERLKGKRFKVSEEDKIKIIDVLDAKTYKEIAKSMDSIFFGDEKIDYDSQYIKIEDTQYLLQIKSISLVTRTSSHDVFEITFSIGHKCPHNESYFVDDDEISVFKEVIK